MNYNLVGRETWLFNLLSVDFLNEDLTKLQECNKKWLLQFEEEKYGHAPLR